jgi:glycine/D-amino acid oxidase-like deaminating enzyme
MTRVVVAGAGIVGASVAYHLSKRGAAVALVDRGQPASECTSKSFAWIGPGDPTSPLAGQPLEDYHRLERELYPFMPISWSGVLMWRDNPFETERLAHDHAAAGFDVRLVEASEIAHLEPNLEFQPAEAAFATGAGSIEPRERRTY